MRVIVPVVGYTPEAWWMRQPEGRGPDVGWLLFHLIGPYNRCLCHYEFCMN